MHQKLKPKKLKKKLKKKRKKKLVKKEEKKQIKEKHGLNQLVKMQVQDHRL